MTSFPNSHDALLQLLPFGGDARNCGRGIITSDRFFLHLGSLTKNLSKQFPIAVGSMPKGVEQRFVVGVVRHAHKLHGIATKCLSVRIRLYQEHTTENLRA